MNTTPNNNTKNVLSSDVELKGNLRFAGELTLEGKLEGEVSTDGVLNLGDMEVETPETVAGRIRSALQYVEPERLILAPDCGMKYLPREVAFGKLCALVEGARIVRQEL